MIKLLVRIFMSEKCISCYREDWYVVQKYIIYSKDIFDKLGFSTVAAPKQTTKISSGGHGICPHEGVQFARELDDNGTTELGITW